MNLEALKIDDGEPRIFYDKLVDIDDGRQYKGEW